MSHAKCIPKFFELLRSSTLEKKDWGPFQRVLEAESCPVCRLLSHLVKQYQATDNPVTHWPSGSEIECALVSFQKESLLEPLDVSELQDISVEMVINSYEDQLLQTGGISPEAGLFGSTYFFKVSLAKQSLPASDPGLRRFKRQHELDDGTINIECLKAWIAGFREIHLTTCHAQEVQLHSYVSNGFKLIDIARMSVIDAPIGAKYFALSYVWGESQTWLRLKKSNIAALRQSNGLSAIMHQLPATIKDAITLTARLGVAHLWVDSLCITQDDSQDKVDQIPSMGAIFERAELVIVAGWGSDVDSGLPGVSPYRFPLRAFRRQEYIHPKARLLSREPVLPIALMRMPWNTRGWTYQESRLGRLMLYFTTIQAYLECRCHASSTESQALDVLDSEQEPASASKQGFRDAILQVPKLFTHCLWTEWSYLLLEYTTRHLSFPQDVLDASAAILMRIGSKWGTTFHFGLPETTLAPALLWLHTDPNSSRRRKCSVLVRDRGVTRYCPIPSWSWAGWIGHVRLERNLHNLQTGCAYKPSDIDAKWEISDAGVTLPDNDPLRPTLIQALAWTAFFDIGKRENETETYYPIMNSKSGDILGRMEISESPYWPNQGPRQEHCELIAIMAQPKKEFHRGTTFMDFRDNYRSDYPEHMRMKDGAPKIVDVLLIKRREDGIAFRVGIGGILWDDWLASKPVQRQVVLA